MEKIAKIAHFYIHNSPNMIFFFFFYHVCFTILSFLAHKLNTHKHTHTHDFFFESFESMSQICHFTPMCLGVYFLKTMTVSS